jgi:hypothetical protein
VKPRTVRAARPDRPRNRPSRLPASRLSPCPKACYGYFERP